MRKCLACWCSAEFRIGRTTILVATDVAARGLGECFFRAGNFCHIPSLFLVLLLTVIQTIEAVICDGFQVSGCEKRSFSEV